jgi:trimeric autotransporter adhesin
VKNALIFVVALGACGLAQGLEPITATANPASLAFSYQLGATALPDFQNVAMTPNMGTPTFTASFVPNTALWLIVTGSNGNLPASIEVGVNPTGMGVGSYNANILVSIPGPTSTGGAVAITIPVTLTITDPSAFLILSAHTVTMTAPPNPLHPQGVLLSTTGGPISFYALASAQWLKVSPSAGVVLPGEQVMLTIVQDQTLTPQAAVYMAAVTIAYGVADASKTQTITVNLTVSSPTPGITSVYPATLPTNAGPQTLTIRGTNFYSATTAQVLGVSTPLITRVVDSTTMLADVPALLTTTPATLNLVAVNPLPGGPSLLSLPVEVAPVPVIQAVVDAASYAAGAISPGEMVTIFGLDIGPPVAASFAKTSAGYVPTVTGGVSVAIDGKPAPVIYASSGQVTVQVPYEVKIGANLELILTSQGRPAVLTLVTTAASAPGIFTTNASGSGQAAASNFSGGAYTLNSGGNPVKIGDYITLYMTGEGAYALALSAPTNTGYIIPSSLSPLPQMSPLPTVMIGGIAATVSYAGPMIGSLLGLLQINAIVPEGATTGVAVPVSITIGGNTSQPGVTLALRP